MAKLDEDTVRNLEILRALNRAIDEGPWDFNPFYKAAGEKLIEIRNRFREDLNLGELEETGMPATLLNRIAQRSGLHEVYVSLYNADGNNIVKWTALLNTIGSHAISRPTYRNEADAKAALRAASNKLNEGYAAVFVREEDIIKTDAKPGRDRYGHELVVLKDKAIHHELITRFVHISGQYEYEDGHLNKQSTVDFL